MQRGVLLAVLFLFVVVTACAPSPQQIAREQEILNQYEQYRDAEEVIVEDHNEILEELRFKMGDRFSYLASIDEYLYYVEKYKGDLVEFKEFLLEHRTVLEKQNINVDRVAQDLQNTLDTMDRNAKEFREYRTNVILAT